MLTLYTASTDRLLQTVWTPELPFPAAPVWIDLLNPTLTEDQCAEQALGIELPTRADMQEIEISSRLYQENGALYMTVMVLSGTDTGHPQLAAVTFILSGEQLVTVRYTDPRPFQVFALRSQRAGSDYSHAEGVLFGLLEAVIDRTADILERIGMEVDTISQEIFEHSGKKANQNNRDFQNLLHRIGREGALTSKVQESLVSINRLVTFLASQQTSKKAGKDARTRVKTMSRDVGSLTDHITYLSGKIAFLLDATLGMINIEQNAIIKIFSVVAVVFLPPTLIASIYGMNFEMMPELSWTLGYPLALGLMVLSAVLPYRLFKRWGWL